MLPAGGRTSTARPTTAGYSVRATLSSASNNPGDATSRHDLLNATAPGMLQKNPPQHHNSQDEIIPITVTAQSFETMDNHNNINHTKPSFVVSYDVMAELEELRARVNEEEVRI